MEDNKKTKSMDEAIKSKKAKNDKRRSFNIVDLILILMCLSFAVIAVFFFAPDADPAWLGSESAHLEYTVEIEGISKEMAAKIVSGDQVFEGENNYAIGTVVNTEIDDCVEYVYNEESGRVEAVPYTDEGNSNAVRKNLLVTIVADADYVEGLGYTVNGYRIAVNRRIPLHFPGFAGEGQCVSLTILDTEVK